MLMTTYRQQLALRALEELFRNIGFGDSLEYPPQSQATQEHHPVYQDVWALAASCFACEPLGKASRKSSAV